MNNIKFRRPALMLISIVFSFIIPMGTIVSQVSATPIQSWNPGYIIDDQIFTNTNTMDVNAIQSFLNSKVPICDTGGTLSYTFNGVTKTGAQWAQYWYGPSGIKPNPAWASPPFTCLKDYTENGLSSAQIIYNVSQRYQINPEVLLVLLQKEQALVTDTWPTGNQYQSATGYGCPDTAACSTQYYGLTAQLYWAGTMFHAIVSNNQTWSNPYASGTIWTSPYILGNNTVYFNPGPYNNSAGSYYGRFGTMPDIQYCGSTTVNIQNLATAALYDYTPYQPDQAALNAGYGTGDLCSSYGNRNFIQYFTDWFGSPNLECGPNETPMPQVVSMYNPTNYTHFMTAYRCEAQYLGYKAGYVYEGAVFNTTDPTASNAVPVYRLYNPATYQHLWTDSQADIDSAVASSGYKLEGIAFYTVSQNSANVHPVYRLYNPTTYQHIWTPSQDVISVITAQAGYHLEGVAFYSQ